MSRSRYEIIHLFKSTNCKSVIVEHRWKKYSLLMLHLMRYLSWLLQHPFCIGEDETFYRFAMMVLFLCIGWLFWPPSTSYSTKGPCHRSKAQMQITVTQVIKFNGILHSFCWNLAWYSLNIKSKSLFYIVILGQYWYYISTGKQFFFLKQRGYFQFGLDLNWKIITICVVNLEVY